MVVLVMFAFLAGIVTVVSPCILPLLPVILAGSVGRGRARPWGIVVGFVGSFTFFTLALSALVRFSGVSPGALHMSAIVVLVLLGVLLMFPDLYLGLEGFFSRHLPQRNTSNKEEGFRSGLVVGTSLGLVWTPCVGPIMAAVITLAASSAVTLLAVMITLAYALGTAIPMLIIMFSGRRFLERVSWLKRNAVGIQRVFGALIIIVAFMLYQGYDRRLQSWALTTFPRYGSGLTAFENNDRIKKELDALVVPKASKEKYPLAPDIIPGGEWFNSSPKHLQDLRGRVVILDFWTYTCINCLRTLPELKAWQERYGPEGLVIIGVHTPEFEFEKDPDNVAKAIKDLGITWPVVQDNYYATWNAYGNRYWPAKYFIDKDGRIRASHFGEGGEEESERTIRVLLKEAGVNPGIHASMTPYTVDTRSPETYLGLARTERFASPEDLKRGAGQYSLPVKLVLNNYAYEGGWLADTDHVTPRDGARLDFHFYAKDVFLVMRSFDPEGARIEVSLDGKPLGDQENGRDVQGGSVQVKDDRLYHLISLGSAGDHTVTLKFISGEVALYAFTFG
jgi:cytochrome c biogenesis protein CcdA/thiol-disulfide isomerase/thioredoxin